MRLKDQLFALQCIPAVCSAAPTHKLLSYRVCVCECSLNMYCIKKKQIREEKKDTCATEIHNDALHMYKLKNEKTGTHTQGDKISLDCIQRIAKTRAMPNKL